METGRADRADPPFRRLPRCASARSAGALLHADAARLALRLQAPRALPDAAPGAAVARHGLVPGLAHAEHLYQHVGLALLVPIQVIDQLGGALSIAVVLADFLVDGRVARAPCVLRDVEDAVAILLRGPDSQLVAHQVGGAHLRIAAAE